MTCANCNSDYYRRDRGLVRDTLTCGVCGAQSESAGTGIKAVGVISSFLLSVIAATSLDPLSGESQRDS